MNDTENNHICRKCNRSVKNTKDYDLFEGMHWICFHFEYEHSEEYDVDEPCLDLSCPWNQIEYLKEALRDNGLDAKKELEKVILKHIENHTFTRSNNGAHGG